MSETLGVCVGERRYMASDNQRSSRVKHSVFVLVKDVIWRLTIRDHHEWNTRCLCRWKTLYGVWQSEIIMSETLGVCVGERRYMASDNQRSSWVKHSVFVSVKDVTWRLIIRDHHEWNTRCLCRWKTLHGVWQSAIITSETLGVCVGERRYMASDNQRSSRVKHSVFVSVKDVIWRLIIRDHHEWNTRCLCRWKTLYGVW